MDAIDGYSNICDEGKSEKKMTLSKSKMDRKVEAADDLCELGATFFLLLLQRLLLLPLDQPLVCQLNKNLILSSSIIF